MKRNQIAWWLWAVGTVLIVLSWIDVISTTIRAANNDLAHFRTNFIAGSSLSSSELDSVIKLANLCEVRSVADVSTIRHLSGTTVEVNGDERFEGRSVIFKKLQIHRRG